MNVQNQTGKLILKPASPLRIVSLVPSITELLYDLGLDEEVVGITKFCVHPPHWFKTKARVGGTKTISVAKVKELQPNLIIANKEENVKEQVEELQKHFCVYLSDVSSIEQAYEMMAETGRLTGTLAKANEIIRAVKTGFQKISIKRKINTLYFIWQHPHMCAGGDTFISSMMNAAGFNNVLQHQNRYPVISVVEIKALAPELILLSSEPYPFKQKHIDELKQLTGIERIVLADGEMFSWYGSRMNKAPTYFAKLRESLFLNDETTAQA